MDFPQIGPLKSSDPQVRNTNRKRRLPAVNIPLVIVVALLVVLGLTVVYSAVSTDSATYSFSRQAMGVAIGAIAMIFIWRFDYHQLSGLMWMFLIINVVLILSPHLPIIGVESKGAQSWINIGITVQPGEFAKVTVMLLDAAVMSRYGGRLDEAGEFAKSVLIMMIPFFCIMTQPDLGTGLVYLFIMGVSLVMGGARTKYIVILLIIAVVGIAAIFGLDELLKYDTGDGTFEYKLLKNYQRDRLLVFLHPDADTSGAGYNLHQAMIAIGSGGFFGKGLMHGTQAALNFLPEAPTDFIFCVLAEELGFVGVAALLLLYGCLVAVCLRIAKASDDLFGMLIVTGAIGMWLFQILENIGMDCGLMPITGIPLPFISFGSSFMLVNFILLGLIGSVWGHSGVAGKR